MESGHWGCGFCFCFCFCLEEPRFRLLSQRGRAWHSVWSAPSCQAGVCSEGGLASQEERYTRERTSSHLASISVAKASEALLYPFLNKNSKFTLDSK